MKNRGKKAVAIEAIVWWTIAVAVLVIVLVFVALLKDKLWGIGAYLRNIFRFG